MLRIMMMMMMIRHICNKMVILVDTYQVQIRAGFIVTFVLRVSCFSCSIRSKAKKGPISRQEEEDE